MRHFGRLLLVPFAAALLTGLFAISSVTSGDPAKSSWPQYRGPERSGFSQETGILKTWPETGPKILWKIPLGDGYSGISIVGERVVTMFSRERDEFVAGFNAADGKEMWRTRVDENRRDEMGDGPRSTPAIEGDMVYALGARGILVAVKLASGEKVWEKDLKSAFGARIPKWGVSTSPIVDGDLVILDAGGGPGKSLVAFDRKTGETKWTAYDDKPGYSTPLPVDLLGVRQILSFAGSSLVSVAAADGKVLWSVPWRTDWDVNAAMPVFISPDKIFISSSYDTGGAVFQVKKTGDKYETTELWRNRNMKNHFNSSIHQGGYLYGFDDRTLKCVDAATGEEKWRQSGFSKGSLLLVDGHLVVLSEAGLLALVEATPAAYNEKARFQALEGRTWTMPSLSNGRLFLRNQKELLALAVAGQQS